MSSVQLALCVILVLVQLHGVLLCYDSSRGTKIEVQMSCRDIAEIQRSSRIRTICNKKYWTPYYCCQTCKSGSHRNANCMDDHTYKVMVKTKVTCQQFAANKTHHELVNECQDKDKRWFRVCCITCNRAVSQPKDAGCIDTPGEEGFTPSHETTYPFTDEYTYLKEGNITQIVVNHGRHIYCFGFSYGQKEVCHGEVRGTNMAVIPLEEGEFVTGISGLMGDWVNQLVITTNNRTLGTYGGINEGDRFNYDGDGKKLAFISGKAGWYLSRLKLHFFC